MKNLILTLMLVMPTVLFAQEAPPIKPGVSLELAKWRAERYSDVRYKLNLTLEKMSPVLKGTMEIRVRVSGGDGEKGSGGVKASEPGAVATGFPAPIILDWRRIKGHEERSTVSNVVVNGVRPEFIEWNSNLIEKLAASYTEHAEHLIIWSPIKTGENVITLDFTSPILTSGSAIRRYVDKEDGAEYIYSLFVPSDASTAFPVFDQPDLKARFELSANLPRDWAIVSNTNITSRFPVMEGNGGGLRGASRSNGPIVFNLDAFAETQPISTYVFAFAAGPWVRLSAFRKEPRAVWLGNPYSTYSLRRPNSIPPFIYVRQSQVAKFEPHADEVFRLNREAVKYFEQYFDYKFPFPKYDLVLIPEFPSAGKGSAGVTFLRESSILLSQEPTKNDLVSRKALIFDQAKNQWSGEVPVRTK